MSQTSGTPPPVVFSFATWISMFAEFAPLTPAQGSLYFNLATTICANAASNQMNNDGNLSTALYVLTSHFAWLLSPKDGNGNPAATGQVASQLVGRIGDASEGSVSVSAVWEAGGDMTVLEKFLVQTKYGAMYWAMIQQYRTARYLAQPTIVATGRFPGLSFPGGFFTVGPGPGPGSSGFNNLP